jgi:hypothetical protein
VTPPRDPVLRAIWRVGLAPDLTPTERIALLVLWRFLGRARKPIGPGLVAAVLNCPRNTAGILLKRLRAKGYIGSDGSRKRKSGKAATRWLTDKLAWPFAKPEGGYRRTHPGKREVGTGVPGKVGTGVPTDLRVRHTAPLLSDDAGPPHRMVNLSEYLCPKGGKS